MRLMIKFFIFILVLGLGAPFILKKPDGTPWMDARQFIPEVNSWSQDIKNWFSRMGREIPTSVGGSEGETTTVYRWRAPDGSWQFSDKPPVQGESETIIVDPNANLIEGLPEPVEPEVEEQEEPGINMPVPMTISPDQLKKLKQDAENIQQLMDDRAQQLDNL
ncbi:MAG: hypothetical protein CL693_00085 [Cellvibrionaceae bacterium]|nr:hypothetical protein [Cellvibrionaceae bacterium]|tara:strand:+ start:927 stop:1415 length:489 start_codon:yes stop_codon:yes gene_type:complete